MFGLYDVIDKSLLQKGYDGEILQFPRIACSCVQPRTYRRPMMLKVCMKSKAIEERNGLAVKEDFEVLMQPKFSTAIIEEDVIVTVHSN